MPVVVEVPPPVMSRVPSPSCPMAYRDPADVPVSVSVAEPPLRMIALSAEVGTVPVLQLLPVVKFPEPVVIHVTSAARSGAIDVAARATRPKHSLHNVISRWLKQRPWQETCMAKTDCSPVQKKT
jgi:hypothetical protein